MKTTYPSLTGLRRCRGGALFKLLLSFVILFALIAVAWMLFLPSVVQSVVRKRTGFDVQIKKMAVNPFKGDASVTGLAINNPEGWPTPEFIQLREFKADTDLWSLIGGKRAIIDSAVVDVALVAIVTDSQSMTNFKLFQERMAGSTNDGQKKTEPAAKTEFLIRKLHLRFSKVRFVDYSGGKEKPSIREMNLNLDKEYTDITDPKQLITGALPGIGAIGSALSAIIPGSLGRAIGGAMHEPAELLKNTGKKAGGIFKGIIEKLEESPKK
ncbi:MAG: hypothetical protein HS122_02410 [Opitutaceae bacterium]|nr:hypothetical protein [Opitutaceae bacterium]